MTGVDWTLFGLLLGCGISECLLIWIGSGPRDGLFARSLRSRLFGAREDRDRTPTRWIQR